MKCPYCGEPGGGVCASRTGDISVCLYCARVLIFESGADPDFTLRKPTLKEYTRAMQDPELRRVVSAVKKVFAMDRAGLIKPEP